MACKMNWRLAAAAAAADATVRKAVIPSSGCGRNPLPKFDFADSTTVRPSTVNTRTAQTKHRLVYVSP